MESVRDVNMTAGASGGAAADDGGIVMEFEKYYRELAKKVGRTTPRADEAKRDYLDSLRRSMQGLMGSR